MINVLNIQMIVVLGVRPLIRRNCWVYYINMESISNSNRLMNSMVCKILIAKGFRNWISVSLRKVLKILKVIRYSDRLLGISNMINIRKQCNSSRSNKRNMKNSYKLIDQWNIRRFLNRDNSWLKIELYNLWLNRLERDQIK